MNRYALGIILLSACSSCVVYRYDVLDSNIAGKADHPFTFEDDTLRLNYSFPNGVATVQIFNKSVDPLYVDWSRSSRITDGISTSYDVDESPISFIPPGSGLTRPLFSVIDSSPVENGKTIEYRYTRESSPLTFRSYLMLSFDHDFYEPFAMDHAFWLAQRRQTREPRYTKQKENTYSNKVMTKGGGEAASVLGVLCAIPIVWVWHQLNYAEEY
jgi:hypothetical protein